MPSPFPGRNPYLEQSFLWHGFHERFVPTLAGAMEAVIGPRYFVEIEQTVYVRETPDAPAAFGGRPDVYVAGRERPATPEKMRSATAVLEAPSIARVPVVDVVNESFLQIFDATGNEVVTVVELLSPSNKRPGTDREQYLAKRAAVMHSTAHFVEIDLLRGHGSRMPLDPTPQSDYYAMVSRAESRPEVGLWAISLRQPLPVLPIPLKGDDAPIKVDLQAVLHNVFDAGGYYKRIYSTEPNPPLTPSDRSWAAEVMTQSESEGNA